MRVLLHTGKGGVGKTTVALATAFGAAEHGHRVFVLSTDAAHSLGDALGMKLGPQAEQVAPGVTVRELSMLDELDRAWSVLQQWMSELVQGAGADLEDLVAEELLALPGLEELTALRVIREVEESGEYDVCVVDCAPTGATLRLLRFPDVLRFFMENFFEWKRKSARLLRPFAKRVSAERFVPGDEVFEAFETLYNDVADVRQILLDNDRTSARLVVNPARVVVEETRRSFAYLCLYGVATDCVLVNRVLPERASSGYFARWAAREREELAEIERSFPVPILRLPLRQQEPIGPAALTELARDLFGDRDPAEMFARTRPIRLRKEVERTLLEIDLPNVREEDVHVATAGGDLVVHVRDAHRLIALPDSVRGRAVESVRFNAGVLEICFAP